MRETRVGEGHPTEDTLLRFLRGEASKAERRAVIRHLLTGCPECVAVTRPVWLLTESFSRTGGTMEDEVTAAHAELQLIIQDVETLRYRLLGVRASLPEREGSDDMAAELRVRLRHIVGDRLHALLEDLTAAADYRTGDPGPERLSADAARRSPCAGRPYGGCRRLHVLRHLRLLRARFCEGQPDEPVGPM